MSFNASSCKLDQIAFFCIPVKEGHAIKVNPSVSNVFFVIGTASFVKKVSF